MPPIGDAEHLDAVLREGMTSLLHRVHEEYPHSEAAFWVPRRLGGSAPTVAEAKNIEDTEKAERPQAGRARTLTRRPAISFSKGRGRG